jgi:hypothetical protein
MRDTLSDYGDAKLVARILHWDFAQTFRDPGELFQLNFFHPARYVLAFSENFFGVSLFGFPLLAAGASAVLNYNVLLLLGMFLSALCAWALARHITGDPLASTVAGVVYAFLPWRMDQIPHLQFQWGAFLCLTLLFLVKYLEGGRRRDLVLYAVAFGWNALANVHFALFSGFLLAATLAWAWLRDLPSKGRRTGAVILATAAACLPFLPFAAGYRVAEKLYGFRRFVSEIQVFSGRWTDFLSASDKNLFWGPLTEGFRAPERQFFPGAAALLLSVVAVVRLWRRPSGTAAPESVSPRGRGRSRFVRFADAAILVLAALGLFAWLQPGLTLGPLRLRDPGRILVFLVLVLLLRLAVAFPGRRFRNLGDFLRRGGLEPRAALLLGIAAAGILVAFGMNTPFYRFFVQSFGFAFRAIRAPCRGIVIFHIALAVLAAWGLSLLTRRRAFGARLAASGLALAVFGFEYRVFPLKLLPTPGEPSAVYRWLRTAEFPGAAVEWPLGILYDFEYVLRQAFHEKSIVNGYSGFFPMPYTELEAILKKRPIPDDVWAAMGRLGTSLIVYHSHESRGLSVIAYADALERAVTSGGLEVVRAFPHDGGQDFVFIARGTPWREEITRGERLGAEGVRVLFDDTVRQRRRQIAQMAPPFGGIHSPAEEQIVSAGFWAFGWVLDYSGIAEVRVSTELGPIGTAELGTPWPGLAQVYPDYPSVDRGGFGFVIPKLPAGPHELVLTFLGNDGGRTEFRRRFVIR